MQMNEQLARDWLRDMPQQFQGKPKIEILVRALANQLEEVEAVFREPVTLCADGETFRGKRLTARVLPGAARMLLPRR